MKSERVLQANLDGTGGAFSLIFQFQKLLYPEYKFDYYWMGKFKKNDDNQLQKLESNVYEENLRKNRLLGHLLTPIRLYKFLKKNNYNIVHINADTAYKHLIYGLPAKMAGVPVIVIHSHSSGINGDHQRLKLLMHNICKPFIKKIGNVFLTCSKKASEWMFTGYENKAVLIKNGVDLSSFCFNKELRKKYRKEMNLANDEILLGTVGNLSYQKYPEYLVDVLNELRPNYKLVFIGDGPHRHDVEKYVTERKLNDRIIFYGSSNKVNEILNALDIYVMTSRFEGLPVSAVEAQATGLPCILSDKMTYETKILPSCKFASIDDAVTVWAELIEKVDFSYDRSQATKILKSSGFDIMDSANKLKQIYDCALSRNS